MNITELREIILSSAYKSARDSGIKIYKNNFVSNIKGKKIDSIYHIYGNVKNGDTDTYRTHIKVDLVRKNVISASCSCEESIDNYRITKSYICKHCVATVYKFLYLASKKTCNESKKELNTHKDKLKLDIKIKTIKNKNNIEFYDIEFKIGISNTYVVTSLKEFIEKYRDKKPFNINREFRYNPIKQKFYNEDERVLDYIALYINDIDGRVLKIKPNKLNHFLSIIKDDKKIIFSYDYIEYVTEVIKKDLPIGFTVKDGENNFILTTKKKLPQNLNDEFDIFLYDRKIYMPTETQVNLYKNLYLKLKTNNKVIYSKTLNNLSKLLFMINKISKDIILDENIKELTRKISIPKFYFFKREDNLLCRAEIDYNGEVINILDNNSKNFLRDYIREEKVALELEKYKFIRRKGEFIFIGNDDDIFDFYKDGINKFKSKGYVKLLDEVNDIRILTSEDLNLNIEFNNDIYTLSYASQYIDKQDILNIIEARKRMKKIYKTKNKYFIDFNNEDLKPVLDILELVSSDSFIDDGTIEIDKNKVIYLEELISRHKLDFIRGNKLLHEIRDKLLIRENNNIRLPRFLNAKLRDYQRTGYEFLTTISQLNFGAILADEMGLGKTVQTITFLLSKKKYKSLVVVPTSLIYNWQYEISKFAPTIKVGLVYGDKTSRENTLKNYKKYNLILTSYGSVKNDILNYRNLKFDYMVIDEAQYIKNPESNVSKSIKSINAGCKIALTGTPIENNLLELWSIFDFIMPGFLNDKKGFKDEYIYGDEKKLSELKMLIKPFILRRTKTDVAKELPEKIERKYIIEMETKQKDIYISYLKKVQSLIKDNRNRVTILSYLTKLRQLCLDPSLILDNYNEESSKIKVALQLIKDSIEEESKILVFSQFTSVLKKLSSKLDENQISYLYLDGQINAKERINLVNEFNNSNKYNVFLISLKAGGTGLNLTCANRVIHFDPWWNPAAEDQATDRAHRIGQKNIVEVIKLIAKDSVEENIILLQEEKKALICDMLDNENCLDSNFSNISEDEINKIFGLY